MDDDPVLRSLAADLEREDPGLAAFLRAGSPAPHHHPGVWLLVALGLLTVLLLLPLPVALGIMVMFLVAASPFAALWLLSTTDDVRPSSGG